MVVGSSIMQYFPSYPFKKALAPLLAQFIFDTKIRKFTYLSIAKKLKLNMMIDMTMFAIRFILNPNPPNCNSIVCLMACWIERYAMAPEAAEVE